MKYERKEVCSMAIKPSIKKQLKQIANEKGVSFSHSMEEIALGYIAYWRDGGDEKYANELEN